MGFDHQAFLTNVNSEIRKRSSNEDKVTYLLHAMKEAISTQDKPNFADFWELRKLCFAYFKSPLHPKMREQLWQEYVELSQQTRKLRDFLDDEASFAVEQIDKAISAFEADVEHIEQSFLKLEDMIFPLVASIEDLSFYQQKQKKLHLYNVFSAKIHELRREIIRQPMRSKYKNKFFVRLSNLGDQIFAQRKVFIQELSDQFSHDIRDFSQKFFGKEKTYKPFYQLREDIRNLQAWAKILTLDTKTFSQTRQELSHCWDTLRQWDNERKKRVAEKQNRQLQQWEQKMQQLQKKSDEKDVGQVVKEYNTIQKEIAQARLLDNERKAIEDKLHSVKTPAMLKFMQEQEKIVEEDKQEKRQRQVKKQGLKQQLQTLIQTGESVNIHDFTQSYLELQETVQALLSKEEKEEVAPLVFAIEDLMNAKKEETELGQATDLQQELPFVLQKKIERKAQIKNQLELYRKALGASGLDLERSLQYQEYISICKDRLDKVNQSIEELEDQLIDLERQ